MDTGTLLLRDHVVLLLIIIEESDKGKWVLGEEKNAEE